MLQSIILNSFVVEPRTVAALPLEPTYHAEFRGTATRHVIASLFQLDHSTTVVAPLPAFLLRDLDKRSGRWVLRAFPVGRVVLSIASRAYLRRAALALAELAAWVVWVGLDVRGLDPFTAGARGAVQSILGRVLLVLFVPAGFEFVVEELVDVSEGDMLFCATFGGHVGGVRDGHGKDALEALVAHPVVARELGCFEVEDVFTAGEAWNSGMDG
jgi:hypothetical protein